VAVAFSIIGLCLVLYWLYLCKCAAFTARWPSVPGQITESRLVQFQSLSWQLQLTYTYRLSSAVFQGHRISFGPVNATSAASLRRRWRRCSRRQLSGYPYG
jgi:hypothetical protein